jgi:UDP-N-acetylmuramyl pentapeptide phosphotransferase/UDP-N-acetylglucosamine-1-phosphate transferase
MNGDLTASDVLHAVAIVAVAALFCAALIVALQPLLKRYAMARPNARSSHTIPTPQGGGIAVMAATLAVAYGAGYVFLAGTADAVPPATVFAAAVLIAGVGVLADIHPDNVAPRLLLQALAVAAVIFYALPPDLHIFPVLPWWIERALLLIGGLGFVNLVNFMDGLDWMTAAEVVPVTAALAAIGLLGVLPWHAVIAASALCGAMIGFAYFNRPVAKLFLGDVGSLPIGLLLGWLLVLLAGHGGLVAAILLPLYYLADGIITIARRWWNGERIWQAHRTHFYQRATDRGLTVLGIVTRVFAANVVLAALAILTVVNPGRGTDIAALNAGVVLVAWLLIALSRGRS